MAPSAWGQIADLGLYRFAQGPVWPTSYANTAHPEFQAACIGKFQSPWDPDAVFLRGGELQLSMAVASRNRVVLLDIGRTGQVALPGQGNNGLDALFTTGAASAANPSGAKLWKAPAAGGLPAATHLNSLAGWQDARQLRLGITNVYALSAAGNTVLIATPAGTPVGSFALSAAATDICPLDFDGNGQEDLAVAYANTIEVRSASSGQAWWFPAPGTYANSQITVSKGHGGEPDGLFWAASLGGVPTIAILNYQYQYVEFQTAPWPCGRLASFDYDSAGPVASRDDVFYSVAGSHDVYVYRRQAMGSPHMFTYTPGDYFQLTGVSATMAPTLVTGGDIDNDGDNDPLFAMQSLDLIVAPQNPRIARGALGASVTSIFPTYSTTKPGMSLFINYTKSPLLPSATQLEVEVRYLDGLGADLLGVFVSTLPTSASGSASMFLPVRDMNIGALQLILREKGPVGGVTVSYPTNMYCYYISDGGASVCVADPEMGQFSPTGALSPPAPGFTQGAGGRGPQTP